jgi:hypothetical protein
LKINSPGRAKAKSSRAMQFLIFGIQLINFLLNFPRFGLRTAHRQHSVRPENILQEQ